MELDTLYNTFTASKQEAVRLDAALRALPLETDPVRLEGYVRYLRRRLRPAVEALVSADDTEGLGRLAALGWLDGGTVDAGAALARRTGKSAALVWLLRWKGEHNAYRDRDLSL